MRYLFSTNATIEPAAIQTISILEIMRATCLTAMRLAERHAAKNNLAGSIPLK